MKRITTLILSLCTLFLIGHAQTATNDNFNAGAIGSWWKATSSYGLSQSGGVLTVKAGTHTQNAVFTLDLGVNTDISASPLINMKIKSNNAVILQITLIDAAGVRSSQRIRIPVVSANFVNYCYDFTSGAVNKATVKTVEFCVNPEAQGYGGTLTFEDFIIGAGTAKLANLSPVDDILVYKGKTSQKIVVTDITNASSITLTGGTHLSNILPSSIVGGVCTITYDCASVGTDALIITAIGTGGFGNNTSTLSITIEDNNAPTINSQANMYVPVGKATSIKLSGIADGNASADQIITITPTSGTLAVMPNPTISPAYSQGSPYATITVNPTTTGTSTITVVVKDDGGGTDTKTITFDITSSNVYNNSPTVDQPVKQGFYLSDGTLKVKLTGISTGDGASQTLTITPTGKQPSVISSSIASYTQGRDTAIITLTAAGLGKDTITVNVTDNGSTNGVQTATIVFYVDVLKPAPKGYVVPMVNFTTDTVAKKWMIEDLNTAQFATYVDTTIGGVTSRCLRLVLNKKRTYGGLWYRFPEEMNFSKNPLISYEILAKGVNPLLTHVYFYDVDTQRNGDGASNERDTISTNISSFNTVFCDFRSDKNLVSAKGSPIKSNRIVQLLFNYHDKFVWPFTDLTGTIYIKNIRLGDSVKNIPAIIPVNTIRNIPNQIIWAGIGKGTITLSGISNGTGSTTGVTVTAVSGKIVFIPHPTLGTLGTDGKISLNYDIITGNVDSAKVLVTVSCPGSTVKQMSFFIKTTSPIAANAVNITVDAATKGQTMMGFGAMSIAANQLDMYGKKNQGCSMMRLTIGGEFEPKNDDNNPNIMDRSKFNYAALNLDYIKSAYDAGVTDFFVTLWSPPGWMKFSLSEVGNGVGTGPNSTNRVDPLFYDEYVEYMVAIVRVIKEETGIEVSGFCPQNEPVFEEPYGSAILDPTPMAKVCGLLGKRLAQEGFKTKVINSEQVFAQGYYPVIDFVAKVKADSLAVKYNKVIAMHYPDDNVAMWGAQWNAIKAVSATNPQEYWGTECETHGNNWIAVLAQLKYMTVGMNYGLSSWILWGYSNGVSGNEDDPTITSGNMMGATGTSKHYWAFKNYSKFVKKGAVQLKCTSSNTSIISAAFKNDADSTMTIVMVNTDSKVPFTIRLGGSAPSTGWDVYRTSTNEKCEKVNPFKDGLMYLSPSSITTIVIKTDINHAPNADPIADMSIGKNSGTATSVNNIGCGDPTAQNITVTATSSDETILKTPVVTYNVAKAKATLTISPVTDAIGTVTVTVIIKDDAGRANGGIDADTLTFKVNVLSESIDKISDKISLYPNPATDVVTLSVPLELVDAKIFVSNMTGQVVMEQKLNGAIQTDLNISSLPAGSYIISIADDKNVAKIQFVKK